MKKFLLACAVVITAALSFVSSAVFDSRVSADISGVETLYDHVDLDHCTLNCSSLTVASRGYIQFQYECPTSGKVALDGIWNYGNVDGYSPFVVQASHPLYQTSDTWVFNIVNHSDSSASVSDFWLGIRCATISGTPAWYGPSS